MQLCETDLCLDDDSYRAAREMVENGTLGEIHAVETTCLDQQDPTGEQFLLKINFAFGLRQNLLITLFRILCHLLCTVRWYLRRHGRPRRRFLATSCWRSTKLCLHGHNTQIDIGRYYLDVTSGLKNPKKQVNRVIAMGQQAVYGDLAKYGDCDNGWAMVEFANGKVLTSHLGRTLTNGFESCTRVCGTRAHSVVNGNSTINRVEVRDSHGVRTATTPDAFVLYDKSFLNDLSEFAAAVLDGKPLTCTPDDAYEAAKIATALQYSFRNGVPVYFDDDGLPIMEKPKLNGD